MAKASALLLILVLFLSLMFQCKVATRIGKDCGLACQVERRGTKKHVDIEDDSGDEAGEGEYDYYRRYGDVPSPGVGH
ncbi:hypothetical protein MANES_10G004600v8 [Manihot esculenta]|uniref:Uncharacterized protein n=1 Tax=Manihot esculenta TaxID=3983 RepID=A0A2C9V229_MANES|nr:hypothetical protein MANES_10G004600v8 [Manihot esculenta]